jgi:hypothetical protein
MRMQTKPITPERSSGVHKYPEAPLPKETYKHDQTRSDWVSQCFFLLHPDENISVKLSKAMH